MTLAINPPRPRVAVLLAATAANPNIPGQEEKGFYLQVGGNQTFLTEQEAAKIANYIESKLPTQVANPAHHFHDIAGPNDVGVQDDELPSIQQAAKIADYQGGAK